LALAEKEQLSTASGNYNSTQSETPILVTQKSELMQQKIFGSATQKCIQSDCSILGLSAQVLVGHIITEMIVGYLLT